MNMMTRPTSPTLMLPEGKEDDPRREMKIGGAIAFLFFVVLLGWAAFAPLDSGVYATGAIAVSGNRQAVQHREGGVVTAIHVKEGDRVRHGQVLVEMAAPDLRATERALTSDYLTLLAQRARLNAERAGTPFVPPPEFGSLSAEDRRLAEDAMRLQVAQLQARSAALSAQESVLGQRSRQLAEQQSGYNQQRDTTREQNRILSEELKGIRELQQKGFAPMTRVRALERAQAELRGNEAAMTAESARAAEGMGEARMQALSLRRTMMESIATESRETQARLAEVLPKLIAAREELRRAKVRAPASGQVVGLSAFTVGGVLAPGQTIMEIVPENRSLVLQAQVSPNDADDLFPGQVAQVRFLSVQDKTLPLLKGRVRNVSADSFTDQRTGQSFFRTEIEVAPEELDRVRRSLGSGQLRPGLPVEVVVPVRKRTALQYLLEPLTGSLWRSFREQ
jgi:HlyD family type I secretion membrane fusion protein